jgi:hypothetical protein
VSHVRDKKEAKPPKQQHQRHQGKKNSRANNNNNNNDGVTSDNDAAAAIMKDMDLPDNFSIFDGGSVTSSNMGGLDYDGDYFDEIGSENDIIGNAGGSLGELNQAENAAANRAAKLADALSLASTLASERRSTKRESGYRTLFKAVTCYATGSTGREILETHWGSIWETCLYSVQGKGTAKPTEQYAACRVIEACSVILGEDRDDIVQAVNEPLKTVVNATGRANQVRAAALRCLAMVHFICGTNCLEVGEDSWSVVDLCEKVGNEKYRGEAVSPILRATAIECWSLLSTTFHDAQIAAGDGYDDTLDLGRGLQILPLLSSCLDSSDSDLRRSAGECVSLIHECRLKLGLDDDEAENTTEKKFRRGSWDGSEWEILMDEVKRRITDMSVESSHYMSRQQKKKQRATFRDFMHTIVDDESPNEVVNWRGGKLTLTSWKEIIQLNFVRHCLQGGFQIQLMTNDTLQGVFGANFDASAASLSQLDKRLFMSKTSEASKAADKAMTKQRRMRTNVKNHFLTADGQDI